MLKFFRSVRRKFINEGKLKSYLVYAIGEILLVVIGILIALYINNWNENQKSRLKESNYLIEIKNEFEDNKIELEKIKSKHQLVLDKCNLIIELFPISFDKQTLDSLSNLIDGSWNYWRYNPKQNAINNFVDQSSFQNMRNKELKNILDLWKVVLNDYRRTEIEAMNFVVGEYDPYFNDNFDFEFDLSDPRTNLELLQTIKFENKVKERAWQQNYILTGDDYLKNLESTIDKILDLTGKEIN